MPPRSGPRPYECVRRAWHSDRHQPIRGSLIQEIFRIVNEIHGSTTKKNKEWQEKHPIVVLRAEEIIYSKANSEADYMDLKTLKDRATDAINTIIRLDETTETGVFLQPCIEAALILGCTPRRASRSQRNNTPSYYLTPSNPDPTSIPSSNLQNKMSSYSDCMRPATTSFTCLAKASQSPAIYPLHYGDHLQTRECKFSFETPSKLNSHSMEPGEMVVKQNPSPCKTDALKKNFQADIRNTHENLREIGCDLSLRLGCLGDPCKIIENSFTQEAEDFECKETDKKSFHKSSNGDPGDLCSRKWISETESLNVNKSMRKRKAAFNQPCEDKQFFWHPKLPFNHFTRSTSNAEP